MVVAIIVAVVVEVVVMVVVVALVAEVVVAPKLLLLSIELVEGAEEVVAVAVVSRCQKL